MAKKIKTSQSSTIKPAIVAGLLNDSLEMMRAELLTAVAESKISLSTDDERSLFDSATRAMNVVQSRLLDRVDKLSG